jgi:hypothetical protein
MNSVVMISVIPLGFCYNRNAFGITDILATDFNRLKVVALLGLCYNRNAIGMTDISATDFNRLKVVAPLGLFSG